MKISDSELQVIDILWQESPLTVGQIIERTQAHCDWHANTIKTILSRLCDKQAVSREKDGKRFFYSAAVAREEVVSKEADGFLDQFFNGRMAPLVAHFANRKKLTKQEIEEIEKILHELKNDAS